MTRVATYRESKQFLEAMIRETARKHGVKIRVYNFEREEIDFTGGDQEAFVAELCLLFPDGAWGCMT
jgi:hypothetical protein